MILILLAAAASAPSPHLVVRTQAQTEGEAVLDRQRRQPPRKGRAAGLTAEEASAVMAEYMSSIGKSLPTASEPAEPRP